MRKEKIVLSFIAVLTGLLVAGIVFYLYQTTKIIPSKTKTEYIKPTATPFAIKTSSVFLTIDSPQDESVVDKKILTVSGKTLKDAIVIISTNVDDDVVTTAQNGNFTTTVNLEDGQNQIEITAIGPSGEEEKTIKTVTFSTETF